MHHVFLSLGSNVGDSLKNLRDAVSRIKELPNTFVAKVSSVYKTAPLGLVSQSDFLNIALEIKTLFEPHELFHALQAIEAGLGRERTVRWGPRTIDIDILLFDDCILNNEELIIPHRELLKRAFVLIPLVELEEDISIDGTKKLSEYLPSVKDQMVEKIGIL